MDTAVVQQFLNFFQDYIDLCQAEKWPDNDTSEQEIRNAFVMCQHIEKCLNRLQKRGIIDEFLTVLHSHEDASSFITKNCLSDPPKYVLKKVINSKTNISQMDITFTIFLEMFSEDMLAKCLRDIMVEAASKETLLSNLTTIVDKDKVLKFKCEVLLSQLSKSNLSILDLVSNCNQTTAELLVVCLLNNEPKYTKAVKAVKDMFLQVLGSKDGVYRHFWRLLFEVHDKYFIEMCVDSSDIYKLIVEALLDCGKLLREGMSADSFYIDLAKPELENIVRRMCANDCLKLQFLNIVESYDTETDFWHAMLI